MKYKLLSFLFIIFSFLSLSVKAQGDLMIMPKRIVFDGSERSKEINLANTGNDSATYAISFIQYKMKEDGGFEQIEEPEEGQRFADDFLRYYPRRVNLGPNEAQTVRLQLTKTGAMTEGEYRSHLYFRAVEKQTALKKEEEKTEDKNISINIKTIFGISIPVIIRKGNSDTRIELSDFVLDTSKEIPALSLVIHRKGNMSVYGNISVDHIAPDGTTTQVGFVKGIAVYTPNSVRNFRFQLAPPKTLDISKGKLLITYMDAKDNTTFAKTEFVIK